MKKNTVYIQSTFIYKLIIGLLFMCMLLALSGCVITTDKSEIYDDFNRIVKQGDSYSYLEKLGDIDALEFKDFSGMETVMYIEEKSILTLEVDYDVDKGKFKIVLISPEQEIISLRHGVHELNLDMKKYRIKIVGDHAYGHVSIKEVCNRVVE